MVCNRSAISSFNPYLMLHVFSLFIWVEDLAPFLCILGKKNIILIDIFFIIIINILRGFLYWAWYFQRVRASVRASPCANKCRCGSLLSPASWKHHYIITIKQCRHIIGLFTVLVLPCHSLLSCIIRHCVPTMARPAKTNRLLRLYSLYFSA